jgi:nitroreductase
MEVFDAIKARHSVRSYKPKPVPDRILTRLFDAARIAPSAMKYQPWRFIVVKSQEKRDTIASGGMWARFASNAPVVIVACGDKRSKFHVHDTCIALEHIVLTATGMGLGSCWIVSFNDQEIKELLNIPDRFRVVALLSLGYPSSGRSLTSSILHFFRPTKKINEIAFLEEYGKPFAS